MGKVGGTNTNLHIDSNLLFINYGPQSVAKDVSSDWFETDPLFVNIDEFDSSVSAVELEVNLNKLPHGVYILKTKSTSVKILKQ